MTENVVLFKKLILMRIDERYPDWLVEFYEKELNAKQRSDFTQAVIELLQEEHVEDVNFNDHIKLNLVALCRRLNIQGAEPFLLSLASSLNSREEHSDADSWDLMSEILSALAAIGTNRSEAFLRHQLTSSPNRQYRIGAFTALARINPDEALKYLPSVDEVKTETDKEDFLAMLYGLVYGIGEESLPEYIDEIARQFKLSGKHGEFLEVALHRISKTKRYLDNIYYLRIFRLRCWHGLKPKDIAKQLHIKEAEVYKKWFVLKHEFLIPILIERGILDEHD